MLETLILILIIQIIFFIGASWLKTDKFTDLSYGLSFVSLSSWQHLALISPIYITFLLIFGTGIPTLEKNYNKKYGEAWEKYKKKTSPVIPWFPAS